MTYLSTVVAKVIANTLIFCSKNVSSFAIQKLLTFFFSVKHFNVFAYFKIESLTSH